MTLAAFSPLCSDAYEFLNLDDPLYVSRNPQVQAGLTPGGVAWAFTTYHADNWHPLTWLSLELDGQFYGLHPAGYHLTNVLLHVAAVLLLFAVLRSLTGAVWRSAVVAALFGLHPLRVESVAWIAERKDVLGAFFWMLTLAAYARYAGRPHWSRYLPVVLVFALGLMAKSMLVTLPCVLLLLDAWPLGRLGSTPRSWLPLVLEKLPLLFLAAGACVLTLRAQGKLVMPLERYPFAVRLENALVSYVRYLAKAAWPSGLALQYPHPGDTLSPAEVGGAALLLAAATTAALRWRRPGPYLPVGWFWYVGTLVPVIGLVQVATQALADRYTYIPLVGIFLALTWGAADLAARWRCQRLAALVAGAAVVALAVLTWGQVHYWRDSRTLWAHTLEVTGDGNALAHNGLGVACLKAGRLDEAAHEFTAALRLRPAYADAHYNLGVVWLRRQDPAEAAPCFEAALRCDPNHLRALKSLGLALLVGGRGEEAEGYFTRAWDADPQDPAVSYGLGRCREREGRLDEAAADYRRAAALAPAEPLYRCQVAWVLRRQGQEDESRREYRRSLELDPRWPEAAAKQARALVTHPETGRRNGPEAVRLAEQACQAVGDPAPELLDALGMAYAEVGRFDDAVSAARKALQLAPAANRADLVRPLQERLGLYEGRQPFREKPPAPAPP
jgi:Flp pilus assembly protein TadD